VLLTFVRSAPNTCISRAARAHSKAPGSDAIGFSALLASESIDRVVATRSRVVRPYRVRHRCETLLLSLATFLGPVSVGTVEIIRLVSHHAQLPLPEAKRLVDRCVFDGEAVPIPTRSSEGAASLVRALASLQGVPKVDASIED
jgi:hypothetical protein